MYKDSFKKIKSKDLDSRNLEKNIIEFKKVMLFMMKIQFPSISTVKVS